MHIYLMHGMYIVRHGLNEKRIRKTRQNRDKHMAAMLDNTSIILLIKIIISVLGIC